MVESMVTKPNNEAIFGQLSKVQSNLDYPDIDYLDFSIIRTFSLVLFFS